MAAQITHAAGESATSEIQPGTNAVVLSVDSEYKLRLLAKKLSLAGIAHTLIQEIDPPYSGECTAIGICPSSDRSKIKKILSNLPLLGSEKEKSLVCGSKPSRAPCASSSVIEHSE